MRLKILTIIFALFIDLQCAWANDSSLLEIYRVGPNHIAILVKNSSKKPLCLSVFMYSNFNITVSDPNGSIRGKDEIQGEPARACETIDPGREINFIVNLNTAFPGVNLRAKHLCYKLDWDQMDGIDPHSRLPKLSRKEEKCLDL